MALTRPKIWDIDTSVAWIRDPISVLNQGSTSANVDIGFLMNRANGLVSNVAIYWNELGNAFVTAFTTSTGGVNANIAVTKYANLVTGGITVSGAITPDANLAYDIGTPTLRFRSLYLSGNTIDLSGATIKSTQTSLVFTNPQGGSFSVTGTAPGQSTGTFGNVIANSGIASTSTTTGALQVTGGAGISGAVYASSVTAGSATINGTVVATAINSVTIGNASATLYGTLNSSSASQPNVTTLAGLTGFGAAGATTTAAGNFTISGNLTVNGTTNTINNTVIETTEYVTTQYANTINAVTIGNIGANHIGTGTYLTSLTASNVNGTVATANVSLYDSVTPYTTNQTFYPIFSNISVAGNTGQGVATNLSFNPSTGNLTATGHIGSFYGTAAITSGSVSGSTTYNAGAVTSSGVIKTTVGTASTSTSTGALQVTGGAGITGNAYIGSLYVDTGIFWSANNNVISSGGGGSAPAGVTGQIQYNNGGTLGATGLYYYSGNSVILATGGTASTNTTSGQLQILGGAGISGAVYAGSLYDNGNRVLTSLSSSGAGNLTVSVSAPASTTISLPATGPGAVSTGSSTAIPVITTDTYGRIASISTAAVVAPAGTLSGTTLASGVTSSSLTSVGTITSGTWSASFGAVSGANLTNLTAGNLTGTIPSAVLGNSTHYIGTTAIALNRASASQSLTGVSIDGSAGSVAASALTGTTLASGVTGSSLTTVGNLSSLSVAGTSNRGGKSMITNFTGSAAPANPQQGDEWWYTTGNILYKYINDGTTSSWVSINSSLYNATTSATANTLALRDASADLYATVFRGKATSAQYADLAENYLSDSDYEPGTVVVFGGEKEITVTDQSHDTRVAGVISTAPAYLMNSECTGLPVAFTGRVPCMVQGPVRKGDVLVSSEIPGVAQRLNVDKYSPGCVLGKSLEDIALNSIQTIEVVVGRF